MLCLLWQNDRINATRFAGTLAAPVLMSSLPLKDFKGPLHGLFRLLNQFLKKIGDRFDGATTIGKDDEILQLSGSTIRAHRLADGLME